uniref:KOW domain-containing protein n=1 Tax=candidate division WOR-3 bacterium TaxID=2052148 RepID=A0A7C4XE59_UNCW3
MAHAYTPGLKVLEYTVVEKQRRLPLPGEVLVREGDKVSAEQVVAKTSLPGSVQTSNVAGLLGILPEEVEEAMLKKVGDEVKKDEVIAESKGFFGLFKSQVKSPINGTVESISRITGQVILREPPIPVEVIAYIDGEVSKVFPQEGVSIKTKGSFIQGIFGIGGETIGELALAVDKPDQVLTPDQIDESFRGKIIIGGSMVTYPALLKARDCGVKGIIVGGIEDQDLKKFMGYDIGVAITGSEKVGLTLIVTEGFGQLSMAERTFGLLKSLCGKKSSINGATQIRAGVMRPEVIVPLAKEPDKKISHIFSGSGLELGMSVRIIREPYFGMIGKVVDLPVPLELIDTESKVRVLEVELANSKRVKLPRANVEIIEE